MEGVVREWWTGVWRLRYVAIQRILITKLARLPSYVGTQSELTVPVYSLHYLYLSDYKQLTQQHRTDFNTPPE